MLYRELMWNQNIQILFQKYENISQNHTDICNNAAPEHSHSKKYVLQFTPFVWKGFKQPLTNTISKKAKTIIS